MTHWSIKVIPRFFYFIDTFLTCVCSDEIKLIILFKCFVLSTRFKDTQHLFAVKPEKFQTSDFLTLPSALPAFTSFPVLTTFDSSRPGCSDTFVLIPPFNHPKDTASYRCTASYTFDCIKKTSKGTEVRRTFVLVTK